jgi:predicted dinucleotide-binding enzyme
MKSIGYNNSVAIIGANSNVGAQFAMAIAKAYRLLLIDSDEIQTSLLATKIKHITQLPSAVEVLSCSKDASWEADIIVLASPTFTHASIAKKIAEVTTCKTILQISNVNDELISLQNILPHSHVIKVIINHSSVMVQGENADALQLALQLLSFTHWTLIEESKLT